MRRRLTVAILGVIVGTLVLTVAGSVLLVRRAAVSTASSEIDAQAQALGDLVGIRGATFDRRAIAVLKRVGSYDFVGLVGLSSSGQFEGLPSPLMPGQLDAAALQTGTSLSGTVGHEAYAAVPVTLGAAERLALGIPVTDQGVLVVTKPVPRALNGLWYFVLVGGVVLVVGAAVAALLARRFSAPLVRAVATTQRIAGGDLAAKVPVGPHDDKELAELGRAINAMGDSLGRSQDLARQFLLSVSHELRTPLTSIRGYADAVAEGVTTDVTGAISVIRSETRRLERLVQDLLDLARLDAHQFSLQLHPVDCAAVVTTIAEGARPEAQAAGLELVVAVPGSGGLWVDADTDRLGQIVANLVENALKFAAHRVLVGADVVGTSTVVWVIDDGPGIPAADLPRVFDRHFTSDRSSAGRRGTGLGLAIVAELSRAMGGAAKADSPVVDDHGTRVAVWLPTRPAPPIGGAGVDMVPGFRG